VFSEYWRNAAANAETLREGWYHSGDIGTRDADGHFFIHDRKKNMIISGAENIYPAEIERVLIAHPEVAEAAVIGRADAKWQEVPVAYVVRRAGCACDAGTLEAHLLTQLARFKVPREYVFVDALPRNAMGKVQHFLLRERDAPLVAAKAGTQGQELDARLRGHERERG
jgi:fatty-acyl-CoA synthase